LRPSLCHLVVFAIVLRSRFAPLFFLLHFPLQVSFLSSAQVKKPKTKNQVMQIGVQKAYKSFSKWKPI
jgi:hypothetical protein